MHISQLFLPEVTDAIERGDLQSLRAVFEDLHPSDVAELVHNLSSERVAAVIRLLRFPKGIDVFEQLDLQMQADVLKHLGRIETVNILEELSPDDRVDLLQKLPDQTIESLLPLMAQAERDEVKKLIRYGENTAGALMTTEYAHLPAHIDVSEALDLLRKGAPDTETIYYIYITDSERRLIGALSLRELVLARPTEKIENIMSKDPISVPVDMDQEEVVQKFGKYDFIAIPVVDRDQRLVGIVTHDDAFDVAVEEQTEDVQQLGAVVPLDEPYFQASFWKLAQKRGLWLMLLFVGEFFTGTALRHYHETLENAFTLIYFVPLIVSSGGNAGSQSVTLITRALAVGDVKMRDFIRVLRREAGMGIVLGVFLGVIGFVRAMMWDSGYNISLSIGVALVGVVLTGSLVGSLLPIIFKKMGFDPAIMSSPFVASLLDGIGIVIYFNVAMRLL
ncbi:MAG: magnesium transporter [Bdellovibrionales bacterium]|nr:magnesium transporter [Bdellovibrionales bacterium]